MKRERYFVRARPLGVGGCPPVEHVQKEDSPVPRGACELVSLGVRGPLGHAVQGDSAQLACSVLLSLIRKQSWGTLNIFSQSIGKSFAR